MFFAMLVAAHFEYSCMKKDGDWLDGVNRYECVKIVKGEWLRRAK